MRQTSIKPTDAEDESNGTSASKHPLDSLKVRARSREKEDLNRRRRIWRKYFPLLNLVLFQATWWGIVLSSSLGGVVWLTPVLAITALIVHIGFLRRSGEAHLRSEILLVLSCAWVGYSADSLVSFLGWIRYEDSTLLGLAPLWIASLWVVFPITLRHSLKWLFSSQKVMVPVAFFSGPITYLVGEKFDLLYYPEPRLLNMALHGVVWVLLVQVFRKSVLRQ
jgi:hypothetical protein